jgi:release factor glutamine methyltransferase
VQRITDVYAAARRAGVDRLDAQLLLTHRLGRSRAWLLAHDDAPLAPDDTAWLGTALARRAAGEPLAYVIGEWAFRGRLFAVGPAVLVPRPETEVLVEWALQLLAGPLAGRGAPAVVDLGTGSGAIAVSVAGERTGQARSGHVVATDASGPALQVAAANARRHDVEIEFLQGDWWQPLAGRVFDLALSNPPYIAGDDAHLAALGREPRGALTPEGDGLGALRRIIDDAPRHLAPGGWLLLEHGHDQGAAVRALMQAQGFLEIATRADLAGLERCSGGRRASRAPA